MNKIAKLRASVSMKRIMWMFWGVVLIGVIFSAGMYISNQYVHARYQRDMETFYQIAALKDILRQCDSSMEDYLATGNRAKLVEHNDGVKSFMEINLLLQDACTDAQGLSLLRSIEDSFTSYQDQSNSAARYYFGNRSGVAYNSLYAASIISQYIWEYCDMLLQTYIQLGYTHQIELKNAQQSALFMDFAALVLLFVGAIWGIRTQRDTFARPLSDLYKASLQISQGHFDMTISADVEDQTMQSVVLAFNTMTQSICRMVEELRQAQRVEKDLFSEKLKNAEYQQLLEQANFKALQSQMNPHFMFNTLNSISRTITLDHSNDAVEMIDALATVLRYNLTDASATATLAEELDVVEQYMSIQQLRFADRIKAEYQYDPSFVRNVQLPRFTLQPIVENAVIHGLEPKLEAGTVHLSVQHDDMICEINIWDDGIGMSPDILDKILSGIYHGRAGHTNAIGISNTKKRLESFTGIRDCFVMQSAPNQGLRVQLRIPFEPTRMNANKGVSTYV